MNKKNIRNPEKILDLISIEKSFDKIRAVNNVSLGIKEGEFFEEPIGGDFNYPDW